jgi:hypothetical protein
LIADASDIGQIRFAHRLSLRHRRWWHARLWKRLPSINARSPQRRHLRATLEAMKYECTACTDTDEEPGQQAMDEGAHGFSFEITSSIAASKH